MTQQTIEIFSEEKQGNRKCGDCQLCCKLLPVLTINKPNNTRCQHQRVGKGCAVYHKAGFPLDCHLWSCRWLIDPEHTKGFKRPDRCHYAIDPMPDTIRITDNDTGVTTELYALQVWVDRAFKDQVSKDEDLKSYMLYAATEFGWPTLIRYSSRDSFCVFPPPLSPDGKWHVKGGEIDENLGTYGLLRMAGLAPPIR